MEPARPHRRDTETSEAKYMRLGLAELRKWSPERTQGKAKSARHGNIQVIDMFSGCGGMSLGFSAVARAVPSYRLIGAVDINDKSLATYSKNFNVPALNRDVRELADDPNALDQFLEELPDYDPADPLVLIGCAPCQGFSAHRKKNWSTDDERNSLIVAFAKVAVRLDPDCIVMENVPELLSGRYWEHYKKFCEILTSNGYFIKQNIHSAAEFGTPQERFRAVVIAMKTPKFALPNPVQKRSKMRTVRDAIGDLPPVLAGQVYAGDAMHRSASHRSSTIEVIRAVPKDGGSRPAGIGPACLQDFKGFYDVYGRLSWDKPAITITHYARNPASGRFVHPDQDRGLTQREAARLQSFPDLFQFTGTFDDVFRQIGEAVPANLSAAVASVTLANLRGESQVSDDEEQILEPVKDSYSGVISGIKARR